MKAGDVIGGYRLVSDGGTAGSGRSKWAFAVKDGEEFFIKQLLSPKYPTDDGPGSPATKAKNRLRCAAFEARQTRLADALRPNVGRGGNLVLPLDFFRVGPTYYKVSERIETSSLGVDGVRLLSAADKLLLLRTIAHSVGILHGAGIVHGDLKPQNILIRRTDKGAHIAKVIDVDDAYFQGVQEVGADELIGDPVYYSPELWEVIAGKKPIASTPITVRSDVFALGLVFCQFWSGELPVFDRAKWKYFAACVSANGAATSTGRPLPAAIEDIALSMLAADPADRPGVREVFDRLKSLNAASLGAPAGGAPDLSEAGKAPDGKGDASGERPAAAEAAPSRLKGRLLEKRAKLLTPISPPVPRPDSVVGRLKGRLLRSRKKEDETR